MYSVYAVYVCAVSPVCVILCMLYVSSVCAVCAVCAHVILYTRPVISELVCNRIGLEKVYHVLVITSSLFTCVTSKTNAHPFYVHS